jgi:prepilin-type N-terminal cleavage/methylation domain-containing protein
MRRKAGFSLLEIMVVIAILGILGATAVAFQAKYRQRTVGSEATVMMRQILDAEIMYFLANEKFFPDPNNVIQIFHSGTPKRNGTDDPGVIQDTLDSLKVAIPVGHLLDFNITTTDDDCTIIISSTASAGFELFPGATSIMGTVDRSGKKITVTVP